MVPRTRPYARCRLHDAAGSRDQPLFDNRPGIGRELLMKVPPNLQSNYLISLVGDHGSTVDPLIKVMVYIYTML